MKIIEKQLDEYMDWCQHVKMVTNSTIRCKRWTYKNFLESIELDDLTKITNNDINVWIANQTRRGCCGRSANVRVSHLLAAIRYFEDEGVVFSGLDRKNVSRAKELPARRNYYTQDQIDLALSFADRLEWLLISLSYDCGLRLSELRNLKLSCVSGQRIEIVGKGSKIREVYMSQITKQRLDDWIESEKIQNYLWPSNHKSHKSKPLTPEALRLVMRRPFERAGIKNFHPHALRHSFATNICNNGAPLPVVQKMLGHSSIMTTERYIHNFDGRLREYFDRYRFDIVGR